jgi:hypothetical protein
MKVGVLAPPGYPERYGILAPKSRISGTRGGREDEEGCGNHRGEDGARVLVQERLVICDNGRIVSIPDHQRPAMSDRPLFKWRHFQADIILCGVRWYLRYALSSRDVEELM